MMNSMRAFTSAFFAALCLAFTGAAEAQSYPAGSLFALDAAVRAACPQIDGVSLDGTIFYQPGATCQAAGNAAMAAFSVSAWSAGQAAQAQYAGKLAAGLTIASTGTPALNATYALSAAQQQNLANVALYIAVNGHLPGGQAALALTTASGGFVLVSSTAAWQEIATAVADYVTLLDAALSIAAQGGTPTWPSASVQID